MITKEEAKAKVKILVDEFSSFTKEELDTKSENQIKSQFIDPLFEALGWDMRNEAEREERVLKGRADYILKLGNQKVLVIEAKKTNVALMEEEGRQAVSYAYHNKIKFAVLTNFKYIRIYHALSNIKKIDNNLLKKDNQYLIIKFEEFINKFDLLWLLSKESFENKEIDSLLSKKDEKIFKPVDEKLLGDLLNIRLWLSKDIKSKKNSLEDSKIDEIVQILIDRLIFIRSLEDRGLEPMNFLLSVDADVRTQIVKYQLFPYLLEKFKEFNKKYDSKLFEQGILENEGVFSDIILQRVIRCLYFGSEGDQSRYMFNEIPADLLGNIYEQYLGTILSGTDKRIKLEGESGKRKKMGIYYTPSYIVDYIVKNTVGEYIKNKSIDEILEVKVLDPACGSGSFLIRAFQEICNFVEYNLKNGEKPKHPTFSSYVGRLSLPQKVTLMVRCIYGVDLDEKAVELARLNLLLKLLDEEGLDTKKAILPHLDNNIKCGNSLIDDSKISDRAFNWNAQFSEVFSRGGFDVVIGNPPYVKARDSNEKVSRKFIEKSGKFKSPHKMWDLYIPFIEQGMNLLKKSGLFSMIIPDTIGVADYSKKLVEILIENYSIYQIDFFPDLEVFQGIGIKNKIIFVKKDKEIKKCKRILHKENLENLIELDNLDNSNGDIFKLNKTKIEFDLRDTLSLGKILYVSYGARFNSDKADPKKFKKEDLVSLFKDKVHTHSYTEGKYLSRYHIDKQLFVEWETDRCPKRLVRPTFPQLYPPVKILMSRQKGVSALSEDGQICDNTIIVGVPYVLMEGINNKSISKYLKNLNFERVEGEKNSKRFNIKYILGILNSSFIGYFLKSIMRGNIDIYPDDWKKIPIKLPEKKQETKIVLLVDQMLELQKKYHDEKIQGNEKEAIKQQIKNIDYEIDEEVYKLYGITEEEKKIIEGL
ncbi:MAG: N-6 DNA methylase [Candidatus Pacearchaeota archaeon]|jgi:hypothetical protein